MLQMKKVIFLLLILSFAVVDSFGGGQNRAGTAGAPELKIPVGARYLALVGSPLASATGLEAIYWNPAGLDFSPNLANALFSHRSYIADMDLNFVAASGRLGEFGSVGLSFRSLSIGEIQVTTMDQPDGTGQIINPNYFILGLTYSKLLTDRISIGASVNLISENVDRVSASAVSFDFGVQYKNLLDIQGLSLGAVVKNLGAPIKYDGNGTYVQAEDRNALRGPTFYKFDAASAELPSEIGIGLSYYRKYDGENSIQISTSFQNNNYAYDDYKIGIEYSYREIIFLRGGYLFSPQANDQTPNIFESFSMGFGINLKEFSGLDLAVDYAYVPVKYFDGNHVFGISLGF